MTDPAFDPAAAEMVRRRYGPAQPALEAAMAVTVWACAYPPAAYALQAWSRDTGLPATPDRWLPWWTAMAAAGRPASFGAATGWLTGYHGSYPDADQVDVLRFTCGFLAADPHHLRAAWTVTTAVMLLAQNTYMGYLTDPGLDAYVRHHALTAGRALGTPTPAMTWQALAGDYGWLLRERLQDTPAGRDVLTGVLSAGDIGGWPGELLAARSRWLMPAAVTGALHVPLPDLAQEYPWY